MWQAEATNVSIRVRAAWMNMVAIEIKALLVSCTDNWSPLNNAGTVFVHNDHHRTQVALLQWHISFPDNVYPIHFSCQQLLMSDFNFSIPNYIILLYRNNNFPLLHFELLSNKPVYTKNFQQIWIIKNNKQRCYMFTSRSSVIGLWINWVVARNVWFYLCTVYFLEIQLRTFFKYHAVKKHFVLGGGWMRNYIGWKAYT